MESAKSCMNQAVEKLEEMGWDKGSIKGMGGCLSVHLISYRFASAATQPCLMRGTELRQVSRTNARRRLFGLARLESRCAIA